MDSSEEVAVDCSMLSSIGARQALDSANVSDMNSAVRSLFDKNLSRVPWHESWWAYDSVPDVSPRVDGDGTFFPAPELLGPIVDLNNVRPSREHFFRCFWSYIQLLRSSRLYVYIFVYIYFCLFSYIHFDALFFSRP